MCDKQGLRSLDTFFTKKGLSGIPLAEAKCRCCRNYKPAEHNYHDCRHAEQGVCRNHSLFEAKKHGFALMMRAADVLAELEDQQKAAV